MSNNNFAKKENKKGGSPDLSVKKRTNHINNFNDDIILESIESSIKKDDSNSDKESEKFRNNINIFADHNNIYNANTTCTSKISNNNNHSNDKSKTSELYSINFQPIFNSGENNIIVPPNFENKNENKNEIDDYNYKISKNVHKNSKKENNTSNLLNKKRKKFKVTKVNEKEKKNNKLKSLKLQNKNINNNNNLNKKNNIDLNEIFGNDQDESSNKYSFRCFSSDEHSKDTYSQRRSLQGNNIINDEEFERNFNKVYKWPNNNNEDNEDDDDNRYLVKNNSPFNYENFKKDKNAKNYERENIEIYPMEKILKNRKILKKLFELKIFKNEEDLKNILNDKDKGLISTNIINILNKGKNLIEIKVFSINNMLIIIKTFITNAILVSVNNGYKLKNGKILKIKKIKKDKDNIQINKEFNLELLEQNIFSIFSNDVKNNDKFKEIEEEYNNNNNQYSDLIKHLKLTFNDCLNIIRYMPIEKNNNENINENILEKFTVTVVDFLIDQYNNYKYERETFEKLKPKMGEKMRKRVEKTMDKIEKLNIDQEYLKKNYIASLLLLIYNFENAFLIKKKRVKKVKNKKID